MGEASRSVGRIVVATTVSEDSVLHTTTREVDLGGGVANHVEGIGDELSVGKDRGEDGPAGGRDPGSLRERC